MPPRSWRAHVPLLTESPEMGHAYESLVSTLYLLGANQPVKTLLVASSRPEEGKTTVTINLALAMTLAARKTVIVDADLRRPNVHRVFAIDRNRGLTEVLMGDLDIQDAIRTVAIPVPESRDTVAIVPSGAGGATALNAQGLIRLRKAIEYCAGAYDTVVLDSPPVLSASDALVLAPMVDGVLLVVHTGTTTEREARQARERIIHAGGRLLGVVMTHFVEGVHGTGYHPYQDYYLGPSR